MKLTRTLAAQLLLCSASALYVYYPDTNSRDQKVRVVYSEDDALALDDFDSGPKDEISRFLVETGDNETVSHLDSFRKFISNARSFQNSEPSKLEYFQGDDNGDSFTASSGDVEESIQYDEEKQRREEEERLKKYHAQEISRKLLKENITVDDFILIEKPSFLSKPANRTYTEGQNVCENRAGMCGIIFIVIIAVMVILILIVTTKCCPQSR